VRIAHNQSPHLVPLLLALLVLGSLPATAQLTATANFDPTHFQAMEWRQIGPFRGGRCAAVTGIAGQPTVYYMGTTGGGVWKTTDAGGSWKNISDGFFGGSIGAVEVCAADPNVIYVGGGEKTVRGNVSHGDGMWKSTDAGKTFGSLSERSIKKTSDSRETFLSLSLYKSIPFSRAPNE
jgi:hypothetical protein